MNSRPLLDYLTDPVVPEPDDATPGDRMADTLGARLRELAARLGDHQPVAREKPDHTLSAEIEAILKRKASIADGYEAPSRRAPDDRPLRVPRVAVEPPPMQPATSEDSRVLHDDFHKFTEAVYLIGQAARRFIDPPSSAPAHAPAPAPSAPSAGEIDALAAVLRETVSAFRSVADDLAVSAGEIRHYATREQSRREEPREPRHRPQDDEEIHALRETVAELKDRLDDLLQERRRARY